MAPSAGLATPLGEPTTDDVEGRLVDAAGQRYLDRATWEAAILADMHILWHAEEKAEYQAAAATGDRRDLQALLAERANYASQDARISCYRTYCDICGGEYPWDPDLDG